MPRVVLYPGTEIGRDCVLHAGVVLGSDGFGFATSGGRHHKVPQLGKVVIEDDVELGANTTVDRGTLGETVIGAGSKLDNLVMIAHGVTLGAGCLMAAQSGIAGSTQVGSNVTFAGQSGAAGHLKIADGTVVAAKTAVFASIDAGAFVAGIPAVDHRTLEAFAGPDEAVARSAQGNPGIEAARRATRRTRRTRGRIDGGGLRIDRYLRHHAQHPAPLSVPARGSGPGDGAGKANRGVSRT